MKKFLYFFFILGFISYEIVAKPISKTQAETIARDFFQRRNAVTSLKFQAMPYQLRMSLGTIVNEPFYVFNIDHDGGFVIISGDDNLTNILGYADKGNIDLENAPSNLIAWMKVYSQYIKAYQEKQNPVISEYIKSAGQVIVKPLLDDIKWGQDYPFNTECPTYKSGLTTTHYYTGCVVAAATQIMKYYNYPQTGIGSKSYVSNGKTLTANFAETTYDWNNMLPFYPENNIQEVQIKAPSILAAHFGIAVEMEYAQGGSGAYTMLVPTAFKDYFGYDKGTNMRVRNYYSTGEWMSMIKAELDASRPVYYGGTSDSGPEGHAFVCDGYDSNDYVHINWGWYGKSNGYFMVNHLNPDDLGEGGGTGGYNLSQEIIIGIQPPISSDEDICLPLYGATRLTMNKYGEEMTLMTFLENLDTHPYSGSIGAVLTQNGKILKVLKEVPATVSGFAGGKPGTYQITINNAATTINEIPDGKYEIRLGYKTTTAKNWQIIRHYIGFPGYIDVTIENGKSIIEGIHTPKPDVTLLEKLSTDGELYAKGMAMFHVKLRNNSKELRLKKIILKFQSTTNPEIKGEFSSSVNIYEESTETLDLLVSLNEDLQAGEYEISAYESGYPDNPFDDTEVGRAIMAVLPESKVPVIRITQAVEWKNANNSDVIKQGDNIYLALAVRNYGPTGKVGMITYLQDVNKEDCKYVFQQTNIDIASGKVLPVTFYRKLPVDPGTYRVYTEYITEDGQICPTNTLSKECILTVTENPDILVNITDFNFPENLVVKQKINGDITFQAPKNYSGTVYIRMRQFTNTNGEIAYMGSQTIKAGESKKVTFTYGPSIAPGKYILLIEAKSGSTEGTVGQYNDFYRTITVKDNSTGNKKTIIGEKLEIYPSVVSDKIYITKNDDCTIYKAEIINTQGMVIQIETKVDDSIDITSINKGIYIVRLSTNAGIVQKKVIKK